MSTLTVTYGYGTVGWHAILDQRKVAEMSGLRDLIVNEQEFDQAAMADGLLRFVRLGSAGELRPGEAWDNLTERSKVLAVVLAFKAARALGLRENESASSSEIAEASGVAPGTVRPVLRHLLDLHLLQQPSRGRYGVQGMRVGQALRLLATRSEPNGK